VYNFNKTQQEKLIKYISKRNASQLSDEETYAFFTLALLVAIEDKWYCDEEFVTNAAKAFKIGIIIYQTMEFTEDWVMCLESASVIPNDYKDLIFLLRSGEHYIPIKMFAGDGIWKEDWLSYVTALAAKNDCPQIVEDFSGKRIQTCNEFKATLQINSSTVQAATTKQSKERNNTKATKRRRK
jgi:hypothetical protein